MITTINEFRKINDDSEITITKLDIPDGTYDGSIRGYVVTLSENNITFKCTAGYRNMYPIKCTVHVNNGEAIVCSKGGIVFSSDSAEAMYKSKYGKGAAGMNAYPGMQEYL